MVKNVWRMSLVDLAAMVTELLDSHLVATLLFAVITLRREQDRIVRQVKILASKAVSRSLGCFADFPINLSSVLQQSRGQKSLLLLIVTFIPFAIHASAAPVFIRILCTAPSCSVSQLGQDTSSKCEQSCGTLCLPRLVNLIHVERAPMLTPFCRQFR